VGRVTLRHRRVSTGTILTNGGVNSDTKTEVNGAVECQRPSGWEMGYRHIIEGKNDVTVNREGTLAGIGQYARIRPASKFESTTPRVSHLSLLVRGE
jgi:hypothetical protein